MTERVGFSEALRVMKDLGVVLLPGLSEEQVCDEEARLGCLFDAELREWFGASAGFGVDDYSMGGIRLWPVGEFTRMHSLPGGLGTDPAIPPRFIVLADYLAYSHFYGFFCRKKRVATAPVFCFFRGKSWEVAGSFREFLNALCTDPDRLLL
jgi:hypothetical protein